MTASSTLDDPRVARLRKLHERFVVQHGPWPFAVRFSDGHEVALGNGSPRYSLRAVTAAGDDAIASADLLALGEAFIAGELEIEGDVRAALQSRAMLSDFHPVIWLSRFASVVRPRRGQTDKTSIAAHYDREPEFFAQFLDTKYMCYTEGDFTTGAETLEDGIEAKLEYALSTLEVEPGARILDVGAGWGAFSRYAGARGYTVDSLTLSEESRKFLLDLYEDRGIQGEVHLAHFLHYTSPVKYDAIVNMGATEHLPDYRTSMKQYAKLVRPGGRIYVDALAMRSGIHISSFMTRYVYPGNSRPMVLHKYVRAASAGQLAVERVEEDAANYALTCRLWAERLRAARDEVERRWGAQAYRIFVAYLEASSVGFEDGLIQAYRLSLRHTGG